MAFKFLICQYNWHGKVPKGMQGFSQHGLARPQPCPPLGPSWVLPAPIPPQDVGSQSGERSQHESWTDGTVMDPFNLGLLLLHDYQDNFAGKEWEEAARSGERTGLLPPASVPGYISCCLWDCCLSDAGSTCKARVPPCFCFTYILYHHMTLKAVNALAEAPVNTHI